VEGVAGGGGGRGGARPDSPGHKAGDAGTALRRRRARSPRGQSDARRRSREAHEPRVPCALVPDASPRTRRVAERADGAHLRAEQRPRFEHRRSLHRAAAPQAGCVGHRNGPRSRLPHGALVAWSGVVSGSSRTKRTGGSRLSLPPHIWAGAAPWTVGLLMVTSGIGIYELLGHPIQHALVLHMFFTFPAMSCVVAAVSMVLGFWQVRKGLSSLGDLRAQLSSVRQGRERQIAGRYPSEVEPLVAALNALLDHRDGAVRRAVAKAGDLAHGLKTPLAVLAQDAARANTAGHPELAASIEQQVDRMRRQVDYHLAQTRAAASGATPGARCAVVDSAEPLARTLHRLHAERVVAIDVNVTPAHIFRGQREDLDEMLGNLLDNACKWARSHVAIASATCNGAVVITVDDDGPGLDASMREAVLHRGVRADEAAPGSGLGLAIVRDLAELYGGSSALDASPLGGLRARLQLPG